MATSWTPWLAPVANRGKRNEPAMVVETARVLAGILGFTEDEIADATTQNFYRLFPGISQNGAG